MRLTLTCQFEWIEVVSIAKECKKPDASCVGVSELLSRATHLVTAFTLKWHSGSQAKTVCSQAGQVAW